VLPPSVTGSALASGRSILEIAGTGSMGHGGNFWHLLPEATPAAPLLPKPCHANAIQEGLYFMKFVESRIIYFLILCSRTENTSNGFCNNFSSQLL